MNRYVITALCLMFTAGAQADRIRPDVEVNVPPEVLAPAASARSRAISAASIRIKTILKGRW